MIQFPYRPTSPPSVPSSYLMVSALRLMPPPKKMSLLERTVVATLARCQGDADLHTQCLVLIVMSEVRGFAWDVDGILACP